MLKQETTFIRLETPVPPKQVRNRTRFVAEVLHTLTNAVTGVSAVFIVG